MHSNYTFPGQKLNLQFKRIVFWEAHKKVLGSQLPEMHFSTCFSISNAYFEVISPSKLYDGTLHFEDVNVLGNYTTPRTFLYIRFPVWRNGCEIYMVAN